MKQTLEELIWRGSQDAIVQEHLKQKLQSGEKLRVKFGIDPTGKHIHLGHAGVIRKLKHFQGLGHQIVLIVGDFTARIGDPSDKESERPALTEQEIEENMKGYEIELSKVLDLSRAEIRYNSEWFRTLGLDTFIQLAQQFSVAQMIDRDNFSKRFKSGKRIGLHEFLYPILQGYDSVAVEADIEIGGTDQLFNLLAGRTLQKYFQKREQDIITYDLLLGTDGRKMSKSWANAIWISDEPGEMYGKIMSIRDDLMLEYFRLCSELSDAQIQDIASRLKEGENPRDIKAQLASEIVMLYHGNDAAKKSAQAFDQQFREGLIPEDIPEVRIQQSSWKIQELLVALKLARSKSEAERLWKQGGVRLNQETVRGEVLEVRDADVVAVGKRKFCRIRFS